ncbi:MAG: hypothetical protein EOM87_03765 [Clostridia bacterium]|nr:hypothetical protein [Clostridia bacterium]
MKGYSREESYALFEEAMHNLTTANFILTAKPISDLLKFIVYNEIMQSFVSECNRSINYDSALRSAIRKENGKYYFTLPKSNRAIVALTVNLMYDFDKGNQSLDAFISGFYPATDLKTSYTMFCDAVLIPFRDAFKQAFLFDNNLIENQDIENEKIYSKVNPAAVDQIGSLVHMLRTDFLADNKLNTAEREDYTLIADGLYEALEKGDTRLAAAVWAGMKYTIGSQKKYLKRFRELESVLKMYTII